MTEEELFERRCVETAQIVRNGQPVIITGNDEGAVRRIVERVQHHCVLNGSSPDMVTGVVHPHPAGRIRGVIGWVPEGLNVVEDPDTSVPNDEVLADIGYLVNGRR